MMLYSSSQKLAGESRKSQVKWRSPSTSSNKCPWQYNAETCSASQGLSSPKIHHFLIYIWVTSLTKLHSPTSIFGLQASCLRAPKKNYNNNDIIYRALTRASTSFVLEPPGLSRSDGKRLDGLTLIPWHREKGVIWDVTVTDTVADSYLHVASTKACGASQNSVTKKEDKYVDLQQTYTSVPLAFETLSPLTSKARNFFKSWDAASQPLATIIVRLHSCSSASPSRCSGSTLSRSLTHLRKLLS